MNLPPPPFEFDINDATEAIPDNFRRYVNERQEIWTQSGSRDEQLLEEFQEDFEGWNVDHFKRCESVSRRHLRNYLVSNGIYMEPIARNSGGNIFDQLMSALQSTTFHEWTPEEIAFYEKRGLSINSRFNPSDSRYEGRRQPTASASAETPAPAVQSQSLAPPPALPQDVQPAASSPPFPPRPVLPQDVQNRRSAGPDAGPYGITEPSRWNDPPPPAERQSDIRRNPSTDSTKQETVQPASELSAYSYPKQKQLEALSKIYKDDADKYSGHKDSFQHKLLIFKDACRRACLDPANMDDAFSFMVIGKARDVYLDKVIGKGYNFEQMCATVRSEFETAAWKNGLLTTWTGMSLPDMFDRHPGKSRPEVFEEMVTELRRVQRGLDTTYSTDEALRMRIVNACWKVPELEHVLARPASSAESVCGEIRSVLNIRASRGGASQYYSGDPAIHGQHIAEAVDQYLSERRYNFSSYRGRGKHGGRGGNATRGRGGSSGGEGRQKTCIVCFEPNCWSTSHPEEERRKAFDRYKDRLQQKGYGTSDGEMRQYILDFEGEAGDAAVEDEIDKFIAEMDAISFDTEDPSE